jgi:hypothetical protein
MKSLLGMVLVALVASAFVGALSFIACELLQRAWFDAVSIGNLLQDFR